MAEDKQDRMEIESIGGDSPVDDPNISQVTMNTEQPPVVEQGAEDPPEDTPASDEKDDTKDKDTPKGDAEGEEETTPKDSEKAEKQDTAETKGEKGEESDEDDDLINPDDPKGVQKRINKVTAKRRQAERERDEALKKVDDLAARMERLEKGASPGDTDEKPAADTTPGAEEDAELAEPQSDDFDDYDQYMHAVRAYDRKVLTRELRADFREELARNEQERQAKADAEARENTVEERFDEGRKKYKDFDDVAMSKDVPYNDAMITAVTESDQAADLAYHLGQNRDVADEMSRMNPIDSVKAIGRLEAEIIAQSNTSTETTPEPKPQKTPSKAPPPINPVKGDSSAPGFDPEKASQKDFEKWRKEGGGK